MDKPQLREAEPHPFEAFKATMQKLVKVSKSDLDAALKQHNATKPKRNAGRKPKKPAA